MPGYSFRLFSYCQLLPETIPQSQVPPQQTERDSLQGFLPVLCVCNRRHHTDCCTLCNCNVQAQLQLQCSTTLQTAQCRFLDDTTIPPLSPLNRSPFPPFKFKELQRFSSRSGLQVVVFVPRTYKKFWFIFIAFRCWCT